MFLFMLTALFVLSSAEQPSRNYLPQNAGGQSQGGFSAQGGFRGQGGFVGQGGLAQSNFIGGERNTRPQQEVERSASILKQDQDADLNGNFQYSFETSNGIRAAETGGAAQTQGEFSYQGDDGNTYSVTFSAGEGGFQARGAHLPVPPPIPADILQGLEQNAKDEAAGIFDDGKYRPTGDDGQYREAPIGLNRGSFSNQGYQASQAGQASHQFTQSGFGSANRQGTFNENSGYKY